MLECIMLVGLPGTGKSTWVRSQGFYERPYWMVLSTDAYIESVALGENKTYSEVFPMAINQAEKNLQEGLEYAIKAKMNIVWDQTNISVATRKKKLAKVPMCYRKIARVFSIPEGHSSWLNSVERRGKVIPTHVIDSMKVLYQEPTISEGFDEVIITA
jgi:predicted kinase